MCAECDERPVFCQGLCNTCHKRKFRRENPDYAERQNGLTRTWRERHPDKARRSSRASNLKRKYGLSIEDYERLLETQGGVCAICQRVPPQGIFAVDHDHATGEVRGLLCQSRCNRALGLFGDDPEVLVRAADYLARKGN